MNTLLNIIDKKPEKSESNKIPAGAISGNGDLAVIFDDEGDDLILHISKCDFWKFAPTHDADGGIKTVAAVRIGSLGLDSYHISQYMDSGLISGSFGFADLEVFVAPRNIIYIELTAPDKGASPHFSLEAPDTCSSSVYTYSDSGVSWLLRKFDGRDVERETAAAVCCRRLSADRTDGCIKIRFAIGVVTNFDDSEYISQSLRLVLSADYDGDKEKTREKWKKFFSSSSVCLPDKKIEKAYNGSLYLLACCMGNKSFPPGLFGNFITDDNFPWKGDYHLNYNFEAPFYCVFSSNHIELSDCYMQPIYDMLDKGKSFTSFLGCKGVYFPVSFGPKGLDLYTMKGSKEHEILFLGQKSNASYAAVIPIMRWYATYDKSYAREIFPYLEAVGEFWETYLTKENGRYVIENDAIHEVPYYKGESFNTEKYKKQIHEKNNILSLGLVRMIFKALIDISAEIKTHEEKIPIWRDILENLSDYPTFIKRGRRCFRYTEKGTAWVKSNSLCIQHIYPASQIGLQSDNRTLKIARNTYFMNDRRLDDNGSVSFLPCGARIGAPPEYLLDGIRMNIDKFALPNMLFRHDGGCIEHLSTIPSTVNEMLMQSFEGVIRIFPCWNKEQNASFKNLRAHGAFLVSAALDGGKVKAFTVKSLAGRPCRVMIPDGVKINLRTSDGKKVKYKKNPPYIEFKTDEGAEYSII